jgi:beta-galactosidase
MNLAHCNVVSIGIFSWALLEPQEGRFEFDWLDRVIDKLAKAKVGFMLSTPTGGKPNWMALRYPEIRRCNAAGQREPQRSRHNHCYTSPVYREKSAIIDAQLAQRYGNHPSLVLWHLSNEYGGECFCPLCKAAFRRWLREKYHTVDALNLAYWSRFWSHTYGDFEQIDDIDQSVHGLYLDWRRFVSSQTLDFMRHEIATLRKITPNVPVTTNMMGFYNGLDYRQFAPHLDVISWDAYPDWHVDSDMLKPAAHVAFTHDLNRAMKSKPFVLMESTPSVTNWWRVSPLKRPGVNRLTSLQAVAHGADAVMYFQWRKSRGSSEKFHGAVVDHVGHENTRVFREVAELGTELETLDSLVGSTTPAEVAVVYEWENRWAIDAEQGPRNADKDYLETCREHYLPFWKRGVPVDVIDLDQDLSKYKLLIAPMLYMVRPGVAERITAFVENGGTFVTTYFTGYVNDTDLCFLSGFPGPLRRLLGVWAEELDALPDGREQLVQPAQHNELNLSGTYKARHFCELIHTEGAKVLATYGSDFYSGRPAVTVKQTGKGQAYFVASRNDQRFCADLADGLIARLGIARAIDADLPTGVIATCRTNGQRRWVFLMNFNDAPVIVQANGPIDLPAWGVRVIESGV